MKRLLTLLLGAVLAVSTFSVAEAKDWSTIRFGVDASYPPFESKAADGTLVGFDIDVGNELCRRLRQNPSAPRRLVNVRDMEYRRWENHTQVKVPKRLFGWEDGKFERDYLEQLHRNWRRWKNDHKEIYKEPDWDGMYVRTNDTPVTSRDAKS